MASLETWSGGKANLLIQVRNGLGWSIALLVQWKSAMDSALQTGTTLVADYPFNSD
jgi:hypothetical protein